MDKLRTREVKIIGTLYVGNKQYPLVRQEQTLGIPANISTWTVINLESNVERFIEDKRTFGIYDPPMTITTTMPWLVEYHTQDKFVTVMDDSKD